MLNQSTSSERRTPTNRRIAGLMALDVCQSYGTTISHVETCHLFALGVIPRHSAVKHKQGLCEKKLDKILPNSLPKFFGIWTSRIAASPVGLLPSPPRSYLLPGVNHASERDFQPLGGGSP